MSLVEQIDARIKRALTAIRRPFRASVASSKPGAQVQVLQLRGVADELLQGVELFQHFGHASRPPAGALLIVLPVGGKTAHSVAIASEPASGRPALESGESVQYNDLGDYIIVRRGRIVEIKAAAQVLVDTPQVQMTQDLIVGGNTAVTGNISGSMDCNIDGNITAGTGATGSFTTPTGQVVTVADGIITNIF